MHHRSQPCGAAVGERLTGERTALQDDSDIAAFMEAWGNRCPVIIVPTKYYDVPTSTFESYGVSTVIWANHNMRAAINVMQETTKSIFENQSLSTVEKSGTVVPVSEVFRLQNTKELKEAEGKYEDEACILRAMDETNETKTRPGAVVDAMKKNGTEFFCGVPDSLLKNFCDYVTSNTTSDEHVISANEGTAVAMAAGHHLATGRIPVVYLQNSGLGNIVNPILSLADRKVYSVPMLLMIGWRGEPGKKDEPQHGVQGKCTTSMLKEMGIPYEVMPDYDAGMEEVMAKAYSYMHAKSAPFAVLIKKNTFEKYKMEPQVVTEFPMTREFALNMVCDAFPDTPLVTTTGFTSREVFELREARGEDHSDDFLTVGSMGHCSSIALGIANARPEHNVVAVDGDGAALMHLGGMASVGLSGRTNFKHVLINNGMHDSVGGQPTGCLGVDFTAMAKAAGYAEAMSVTTEEAAKAALDYLATEPVDGPVLVEIKVKGGSRSDLGRPTTTPIENKVAFMKKLGAL
jgi:phosphonopyruvate decarboxylase